MDFLNALVALSNYIFIPASAYGAQLALGALGITLTYAVLRFSNFAHGDTMAFGAMVTILMTGFFQSVGIGLGPLPTALLALPFAILATIALVLATDRVVYRFYRRQKAAPVVMVIVSVGVMFILNGMVRFIIGVDERGFSDGERSLITPQGFKAATGLAEPLALKTSQAITIVFAVLTVAALFWFLNRTRTGKSLRAFADNEDLALLSGINPDRVVLIAWALIGTLAAIAGSLYGLDKGFKPFVYYQLLLPMFAAAIVGGLGNPLGAIAGAFLVAFSEIAFSAAFKKVVAYLVPGDWQPAGLLQLLSTEYKFAVYFGILLLVLLFKPTGLFKGKVL